MTYEEYEEQVRINEKKNEQYLQEFSKYLENDGLSAKTINKHVNNVEFYINTYLNAYEPTDMKDGCIGICMYLGDWFIRKTTWASKNSIKENAASIKKFYKCMLELNHISISEYENICLDIKTEMKTWIDCVEKYNDYD